MQQPLVLFILCIDVHKKKRSPGAGPPPSPHQPSPAGSASATLPQGGSDSRGANWGRRLHIGPGTWFTSCQAIGQEAWCMPQESLPPGGGVGERAEPAVEPVGGGTRRPVSDDQRHYRRQGGGNWLAPPPHQPSPSGSASATPPRGGSDWALGARASRPHP